MSQPKIARNAPCPCGSGKKYKHCCYGKSFTWVKDVDGQAVREIPLAAEAQAVLEQQREKFRQHFGREPGPDDLLFFDAPPQEQVEQQLAQALKRAGVDPAWIYAFEKSGRLVTTGNQHLIPDKDLQEWYEAVAEYRAQHRSPP